MKFCRDCPCWCPPDLDGQMGNCRALPPVVVKAERNEEGQDITTSAWPPARPDNWCYRGRRIMRRKWWFLWLR